MATKYAYIKFVSGVFEGASVTDTTFSSKQTGAFGSGSLTTANCYASIHDAVAYGGLTSGDFVFASDIHVGATNINVSVASADITFISVSDTNCDQESIGAEENSTAGHTLYTGAGDEAYYKGFSFIGVTTYTLGGESAYTKFDDCTFRITSINHGLDVRQDGANVFLNNCTLNYDNSNNKFYIGAGCRLVINNLKAHASHTVNTNGLIDTAGSGGLNIIVTNTDIPKLVSVDFIRALTQIDDNAFISLNRCIVDADKVVSSTLRNTIVSLTSCDTGDGYHYYDYRDYKNGDYSEDTTYYLNATYNGSDGFSTAMNGVNNSVGNPLRHKLATLPQQSGTTATTYRINFASASQLYTNNFFIEAEYSDDTTQALGVIVSTREADILATGTEHTTYSGDTEWSGGGFTYEYEIDIVVPQRLNVSNGLVAIYANLTDVIDVNVCPKIGID